MSFVNESHNADYNTYSSISAPALSCTAGNALVVFIGRQTSSTVDSVSDDKGNQYNKVTNYYGYLDMWFASDIVAGNTTVTATFSTSAYNRAICVMQYSGINTVDVYNTGAGSSSSFSTTTTTTTKDTETIVAGFYHYSGESVTHEPGTNFTERTDFLDEANGYPFMSTEDRDITSIGDYNATMTASASVTYRGIHATFYYTVSETTNIVEEMPVRLTSLKSGSALDAQLIVGTADMMGVELSASLDVDIWCSTSSLYSGAALDASIPRADILLTQQPPGDITADLSRVEVSMHHMPIWVNVAAKLKRSSAKLYLAANITATIPKVTFSGVSLTNHQLVDISLRRVATNIHSAVVTTLSSLRKYTVKMYSGIPHTASIYATMKPVDVVLEWFDKGADISIDLPMVTAIIYCLTSSTATVIMDTKSGAVTEYSDYMMSLFESDSYVYGIGSAGVYRFSGVRQMDSSFTTGYTDFKNIKAKSLTDAYLDMTSSSDDRIQPVIDSIVGGNVTILSTSNGLRNRKADLGKGISGRLCGIKYIGSDFSIDSIKLVADPKTYKATTRSTFIRAISPSRTSELTC